MKTTYDGSVGVPELDERHKRLFERFALIKNILAEGGGWNEIHAELVILVKDLEFCFAVEEALMRIHQFPDFDSHITEHAGLLQTFRELERANLSNGLTANMLGAALAATMVHHLTQNRRYTRYLPKAYQKA